MPAQLLETNPYDGTADVDRQENFPAPETRAPTAWVIEAQVSAKPVPRFKIGQSVILRKYKDSPGPAAFVIIEDRKYVTTQEGAFQWFYRLRERDAAQGVVLKHGKYDWFEEEHLRPDDP